MIYPFIHFIFTLRVPYGEFFQGYRSLSTQRLKQHQDRESKLGKAVLLFCRDSFSTRTLQQCKSHGLALTEHLLAGVQNPNNHTYTVCI